MLAGPATRAKAPYGVSRLYERVARPPLRFTRRTVRILGVIAIVLAATGSAVAASKITSAQIKDGTITGKDIKNFSVGASKLTGAAKDELEGVPGPAGPAGPQGPAGPSAVSKLLPATLSFSVPGGSISAAVQSITVTCPAGQRVISGGYVMDSGVAYASKTYDGASWTVGVDNYGSSVTADGNVTALCSAAGVAVASKVGHAARDAEIARDLRRQRNTLTRLTCKRVEVAGKTKCLSAGQYCATRSQKDYRRAGFKCVSGRLRRA